ncbi:MAG: MBL fold metallo-hydrolase [Tepidisphaera sp.]|nr:MBL fold metallo-hydrolase [Tepidisphaera sp.]
MRLSVYGAAGEVTGSCYVLETARARVMIDFGLHQGGREEDEHNRTRVPPDLRRFDAVVVTHAHIDHIGRLPLLAGAGFSGPIYASDATADLIPIMLRDTARLQEADAARDLRRQGPEKARPALYTSDEVEKILPRVRRVPMQSLTEIAPGVKVRLVDSGHMLGSASIELRAADGPGTPERVIIFSGDIGPWGMPLLRDPRCPAPADGVKVDLAIMESTYGDRDHRPLGETVEEANNIVREATWDKQRLLIPAFAVGRSQVIVYYLGLIIQSGRAPRFPVYLDSPMAIEAMELYKRHTELLDADAHAQIQAGTFPLDIPELRYCRSAEESKRLNDASGALAIIAGSGMCNGGRIIHHLRHGLWRKDVQVIIAGYQAAGTLGRQLVDGAKEVRIFGDTIPVRAKVHTLGGFSAHAGRTDLIRWATDLHKAASPRQWILTHGEDRQRRLLGEGLAPILGQTPAMPAFADHFEL